MSWQRTKAALRRWYLTRFKDHVILRTYSEFPLNEDGACDYPYDCKLEYRCIPKSELPKEAVHCTGEKYVYSLDTVHRRYMIHDRGFGATDACLYMEFDGFQDALTSKWTDFSHFDMKKFLIIAAIIFGVAVAWLMLSHR